MSAVVSAMLAIPRSEFSSREYDRVKSELVLAQRGGEKFGFGEGQTIKLFYEVGDKILVPRFYGLTLVDGRELVDKTVSGGRVSLDFKGTLRGEQERLVDGFLGKLKAYKWGGILCAPCGTGKTVIALKLFSELKVSTLVLVHTTFLMEQWIERAQEFLGLRKDEIGRIQQGVCDWRGRPLVIGMIESLVAREYEKDMYSAFGCVCSDEVHRFSAPLWRLVIEKFPARIRIGVTATDRRGDGLWNVVKWHIGDVLVRGREWDVKPKVFCLNTGAAVSADFFSYGAGKVNLGRLITILSRLSSRNKLIVGEIVRAVASGRRPLVLSDRREHLVKMRDMFLGEWGDRQKVKIGFYVGGMDREALDYARTCDLLFGTAQYCREALDDPGLDSIFLTMPKGDVEQPIGRILRKVEGKKEPLVVDFVDEKIWVCKEFAQKRQNLYKRLGFEVVHIE